MIKLISDVHEAFRETDETGWFLSGGCYDYAYGFGNALEALDIPVKYWELGSESEPMVHVAIEVLNYFIDFNTFSKNIDEIYENGDFYADTELGWSLIKKEDIDFSDDLTDIFIELIDIEI